MTEDKHWNQDGGCACREVRYRITRRPMFVHCCHCTWCQRETGTAFALNAIVETDCVEVLQGSPEKVYTPSNSGAGQTIVRCPTCKVAVWSHYSGGGDALSFIRVGSLDHPDKLAPDIHIFTSTKLPWVILPTDVPSFDEYYDRQECWPEDSLARRARIS